MFSAYREKIFSKEWFLSYSMILVGTFILSVGMVLFISPYKIVPGGVYGISIILHHLFGTPLGMVSLCMDIPLTLLGMKILGKHFGAKTVVGFVSTAFFVDGLSLLWGELPLIEGDALLSSIFGGAIVGLGLGLVFRAKATSGGTDIVATILAKYTHITVGQLLIYVDSCIVLLGLAAFQDWKIPFYSWIVIYVTGKVVDAILQGMNYNKAVFIISDKYDEIREKILHNMGRGGTCIHAEGMFSGLPRKMIYTNISRGELPILQAYIKEIDPMAFITVLDASEVIGDGFKSFTEI
ncbi:MAG: YitT family protein [Bacteroidales bacterium]|nr:YitT family protein [Bacteroidales bacterium]